MSIEGKKVTLTGPTPVRLVEAGANAHDLYIKNSGRRMFIGTDAAMTDPTSYPVLSGNSVKRFTVPAGVDVYAMMPDTGAGSYPYTFNFLAVPFDGPSGTFSCARLPLSSTATSLNAVSADPVAIEVTGFARIGGSGITPSDGFDATSLATYRVDPGEQLFIVEADFHPGDEAYTLVSTYIER
ncbi:hypothetical protein [Streptomyces sp. NPDC056242]|uniref:hypothetical protein n=1 Tax=Streptomyces sp. NPDC056242 TaxID=3345760 RepID=UPI0035E2D436